MNKHLKELIDNYAEKSERAAVLEDQALQIRNICHAAELEYAEHKKQYSTRPWDLKEVQVDAYRILEILGYVHSKEALDIMIEMEREMNAKYSTNDNE